MKKRFALSSVPAKDFEGAPKVNNLAQRRSIYGMLLCVGLLFQQRCGDFVFFQETMKFVTYTLKI